MIHRVAQSDAGNALSTEPSTRRVPAGLPLNIPPSLPPEAGDTYSPPLSLLGAAPWASQ